jgi:hypothetical protein
MEFLLGGQGMIYLRDTNTEVEITEGDLSDNFVTVKIKSTGETKVTHVLGLVADNSIDEIISAIENLNK